MAKAKAEEKAKEITQEEILAEQKQERLALIDRIEAEIVRHERCFDDYNGGLCKAVPDHKPMALHQLRLVAIKVQNDPESLPSELKAVAHSLAQVQFVYPIAK